MNIQKIARFLRKNMLFYIIGFLLLLGMKYFYSRADAESLRWILGPTAGWVETLCGIPFAYERGMGYVNHELRYVIAPSCSGFQFLIITAAMLIFSFVHKAALPTIPNWRKGPLARTWRGLCWILISLPLSYLLTVLVNGLRIVIAIYLPSFFKRSGALDGFLTADRLHTMIGVVVYFASLLVIHPLIGLLFGRTDSSNKAGQASAPVLGKCLSPVFWYFLIVLGIPFLNRAWQKGSGRFTDFCLLVTSCCGFVLLLYGLAHLAYRLLKGRR